MKERDQSTKSESLQEKTRRWFWQGIKLLALGVGAVVVLQHLPQIVDWAGEVIRHA